MNRQVVFPFDFNQARKAFAAVVLGITKLDQGQFVEEEPESQDNPRPALPYFSFKFTTPAAKSGDDTKYPVLDSQGKPTGATGSGGVREMTVAFNCYGTTHEEAYNYMGLLQTALELEDVQQELGRSGIAVWIIGAVADLSKLLNTGFEGRAHMDCKFGIAMNLQSDLGSMETVPVQGGVTTDGGSTIPVNLTVTGTEGA